MASISVTPDPVAPGGTITVCYTFNDGQDKADLTLSYDTDNGNVYQYMRLTRDEPCQTRIVLGEALGLLTTDDDEIAQDVATTVQP